MKHETVRATLLNGWAFSVAMHVKETTLHGDRTSKPRDGRM